MSTAVIELRNAAALIRTARERAGLTQTELAARAGLQQSVVSAYERGRRDPGTTSLVDLIGAAGFRIELDLVPAPPPFTGPVGRKLQLHRDEVRVLLLDRGYGDPQVFGSVARNEDTEGSDVDLLVDLPQHVGLLQVVRAGLDMEDLLGVPVDLAPREGPNARVAAGIESELVTL